MKRNVCLMMCVVSAMVSTGVWGAEQRDMQIVVGAGFVISPGYNDFLNDVYEDSDMSGGYGWLDLEIGARFNINPHFSVTPGFGVLLNSVAGTDTYINLIGLPSVTARYTLFDDSSFYLEGGVNYGLPNTGGDRFETKAGGVGFSGALGYTFSRSLEIQLGYLYIPVDITRVSHVRNWDMGQDPTKDFGGVAFGVKGSF